jgi:hypothetical protein
MIQERLNALRLLRNIHKQTIKSITVRHISLAWLLKL